MFFNNPFKSRLPNADEALAGRATAVFAGGNHAVLGTAPYRFCAEGDEADCPWSWLFLGCRTAVLETARCSCNGGWLCWRGG